MALKTRPNRNEIASHFKRISRSGRPQIGVIRDRTALGQAARRLNGASWGVWAVHLVGPNSGISFWAVHRPRADISAMFPAQPRAGGGSAGFGRVLGAKTKQLPAEKKQNATRVRSASLISPVRRSYYDLPARGGQKTTPRERDARNQRDEPPTATKWRMSTHLFLAITLMTVSGADKHLCRTRPPGPLFRARATDAPPQRHAGDMRSST